MNYVGWCSFGQVHKAIQLSNNVISSQAHKILYESKDDNLSLFSLNWDSFYNLIQEMGQDSCAFDVIGVTELFSMSTGECTLSGYHPLEYKTRTDSNKSREG